MGQQILFFFSVLGVFNALIVSAYLLCFRNTKTVASQFLGLLLLTISIRITRSVFLYFYPELPRIYLQLGLSSCLLIGPSLYYFIKAALNKTQKTPNLWKWICLFWILVIGVVGIIFPYQSHAYLWDNHIEQIINTQWGV